MNILQYFDLGILPDQPTLGKKDEEKKRKKKIRRILLTLGMYVFLWLGVLGQRYLSLYQDDIPITWETFGTGYFLLALVIATAIFPTVFPLVFAKMPKEVNRAGKEAWVFVQLATSFQQGFFWQALLELLVPKA